ncbi:MAG TPA: 50S ribosomal protein L13, partial [Candidatus Cloacimonas sp.]|nr:50S ribosomal protein L13 [Candidatus Cloacimonas sp.]
DYVIVINAAKVRVTGMKALQKVYKSFSGYPSGLKEVPYAKVLEEHPERIIEHSVKGMLPKNKLGRAMLKKLKVYSGAEHPHSAQKPVELNI